MTTVSMYITSVLINDAGPLSGHSPEKKTEVARIFSQYLAATLHLGFMQTAITTKY